MDRQGRPYVSAELRVPLEHAFDARDHGDVHVDDAAGGFELDRADLGMLLAGVCRRCGASIDHRRQVELCDGWRLLVDIAVVPPVERTWQEPESTRDALDLGWSLAPVCRGCRRVELRGRFDLLMERWRAEGKIRR
jgi:hypothetical protein